MEYPHWAITEGHGDLVSEATDLGRADRSRMLLYDPSRIDLQSWRTERIGAVTLLQEGGEQTKSGARLTFRRRLASPTICSHNLGHEHLLQHCAGCGEVLIGETFDVGDDARVYLDRVQSCLTRYGHFWRSAAVTASVIMTL